MEIRIAKTRVAKSWTYPIEKITCPVLTISAQDDAFGTSTRAKSIAAGILDGTAILFAKGGHALIGYYADALQVSTSFFPAVRERQVLR